MMKKSLNVYVIFILIAAAFWGVAGIFVRNLSNYNFPQMEIVFWRAFFTALIMLFVLLFKDKSLFKIKLIDIPIFLLAGLCSIVLFNYSYYKTMSYAPLSVAAVLLYTAPFFVVIISALFFGERINLAKISALIIAFVGCCFVTGLFGSNERIRGIALLYGLLTGFGYGLYTIFGNILIKRGYNSFTITFYVFLATTICASPFINFAKTVRRVSDAPVSIVWLVMMAVVNTVLPYLFYTKGLEGVNPSVAPIIATVEPVVATLVGALLFKEKITVFGVIGIFLVLLSVAIINRKYISLRANAKINLYLAVLNRREDGYHELDTVMQSVGLYDRITVTASRQISVDCSEIEIDEKYNIAFKAADLFFKTTGIDGGAKIKIKKYIPSPGGLGGGSADAAAVLLALNKMYDTKLSDDELKQMAVSLGADVPFFIKGGTARATGIGELLEALPHFNKGYFVLCKTGSKTRTGDMYNLIDKNGECTYDVDALLQAVKNFDTGYLKTAPLNSFEELAPNPEVKSKLYDFGAKFVSLSGSGPVMFGYFDNKLQAKKAYKSMIDGGIAAYLVKPCDKAIVFE